MEREVRNLIQTKQNRLLAMSGFPYKSEGSNTDMRISLTQNGVELFVKYNGEWYKTTLTKIGG